MSDHDLDLDRMHTVALCEVFTLQCAPPCRGCDGNQNIHGDCCRALRSSWANGYGSARSVCKQLMIMGLVDGRACDIDLAIYLSIIGDGSVRNS